MSKVLKIIFCAVFLSQLFGCDSIYKKPLLVDEIAITAKANDFKIPKSIFDEIEMEIQKEPSQLQSVYLFSPLKVILYTQSGILKSATQGALQLNFPVGGGVLDFKDYIQGQGSFSISFPPEQFKELPSLLGLYFLSDSPQRKIDNEEFGLGCGKMAHLKSRFSSLQEVNYLKLNTTQLRHLYVVSGTFIFAFRDRNKVYLSHLHVKDSRYPDFYCSSLYKQQ